MSFAPDMTAIMKLCDITKYLLCTFTVSKKYRQKLISNDACQNFHNTKIYCE